MTKKELLAQIEELRNQVLQLTFRVGALEARPSTVPVNPWSPAEPYRVTWGSGTADPLPPMPNVTCVTADAPGTMSYPNEGAFPTFDLIVARVMAEHADLWRELADA